MSLKSLNLDCLNNKSVICLNKPMVKTNTQKEYEHLYIGNIPVELKTADIRCFFKEFIEKSAFNCFHYRHRPETNVITSENSSSSETSSCCCIVRIYKDFTKKFIQTFHTKTWCKKNREFLNSLVNLKILNLNCNEGSTKTFLSKAELKSDRHIEDQNLYEDDLKTLIELNPPSQVMPNGNVGTTTKYFLSMISQCKMPISILKKLGIEFPKSVKTKAYSSVPMNYEGFQNKRKYRQNSSINQQIDIEATSSCKQNLVNEATSQTEISHDKNKSKSEDFNAKNKTEDINASKTHADRRKINDKKHDREDSKSENETEDRDAEDWERHEALHDDVDNQSRPKERLFEEDLEVKWEKGGSGLVFYTDSFFWNELKGKDFDEDTVDDWDVDYSIYYENGAGDKPARDQLQMRIQQRRRHGLKDGPIKYSDLRRKAKINKTKMDNFGEFEKYSKGFGSKILKQHGWSEGTGLGSWKEGIKEPIDPNGQPSNSRDGKIGLGYFGEKLDRSISLKRNTVKDVYISSIYDKKKDGEQMDAMRYYGKEIIKYRPPKIKFETGMEK